MQKIASIIFPISTPLTKFVFCKYLKNKNHPIITYIFLACINLFEIKNRNKCDIFKRLLVIYAIFIYSTSL